MVNELRELLEIYLDGAVPDEVIRNIADHLLDNGVIVPPVRVGQTVYQTDGVRIYELTVNGGSVMVYDTDSIAFSSDAIGKSIFLTREAAEAALKARGKK